MPSSITTQTWLLAATEKLTNAGISTARLDALVLLEDITSKDRAWLLAHSDFLLTPTQAVELGKLLSRRASHEPLAYIRGKTEFYGREFLVDKRVLEPRPESETMIELLLQVVASSKQPVRHAQGKQAASKLHFVDVGTGSGALAITAKLEFPEAEVIAIDIDENCLEVARINARKHRAKIAFYQGNLLQPLSTLNPIPYPFVVLANLPYVPDSHTINQAAEHEPKQAIFGGPDGLDKYRHLFYDLQTLLQKPEFVLTESLPFQHQALGDIAAKAGYKQQTFSDFVQVFKKL